MRPQGRAGGMTTSTFDTLDATITIMDVDDDCESTRLIKTIDMKVRMMCATTADDARADGTTTMIRTMPYASAGPTAARRHRYRHGMTDTKAAGEGSAKATQTTISRCGGEGIQVKRTAFSASGTRLSACLHSAQPRVEATNPIAVDIGL